MQFAYRSPLPIFHLLDNCVMVVRTSGLDCLFTNGREVKIGNKSRRFLRVCAEKNVANTDIPVIDSELIEGMETLGRYQLQTYEGEYCLHTFSGALCRAQ